MSSTSLPGGNQVDGLPPVCNTPEGQKASRTPRYKCVTFGRTFDDFLKSPTFKFKFDNFGNTLKHGGSIWNGPKSVYSLCDRERLVPNIFFCHLFVFVTIKKHMFLIYSNVSRT